MDVLYMQLYIDCGVSNLDIETPISMQDGE